MEKSLVVYFSASGVTSKVANNLAKSIDGDIYAIRPEIPYTDADLNWMDKNSRSTVEMKDWNSRPDIIDDNLDISQYSTVFVGFPIWWYIAPTIVNTFLEKHDFSNKKLVLFATSGGSGFGKTIENIKPSVDLSTEIVEGRIFNNDPTIEELKNWASSVL